jgi:hypothetical protein
MSKHGRSTANPHSDNKRSRIQTGMMQGRWQIVELQSPESPLRHFRH